MINGSKSEYLMSILERYLKSDAGLFEIDMESIKPCLLKTFESNDSGLGGMVQERW